MEMETSESSLTNSPVYEDVAILIFNWLKKFEQNTLKVEDIHAFWARNVQRIYAPTMECDCLNIVNDNALAQKFFFDSLEQFIVGSNDQLSTLQQLKQLDGPPTLCGRLFKIGEATYYCRDCGLDPTVVLCVDCFKNSVHKSHRYKLSLSGGGGYCDCGDQGAFLQHASCSIHNEAKIKAAEAMDPLKRMPQDMQDRARFVMEVVLNYCHEMLTWAHCLTLPDSLQAPSPRPDLFTTILFNDEIHTYDQVISTLNRAMNCTQKAAVEFATTIDREGRSMVRCSTYANCKKLAQTIEKITSRHGNRPLKVLVMHSDIIAHQIFSMKLLGWIQNFVSNSECFRIIFGDVIMKPEESPLLESVMLSDMQLWKTARSQWHQLFITSMHVEQQCKKTFAKVFTRIYPTIMKDFIADDHEHSASITSLSVQVFTMPLAHVLIEEENAMTILLRTFLSECEHNCNEVNGRQILTFERNHFNANFRRGQYILYDLKYLLTVIPKEWTDNMRKHFTNGVQELLKLMLWMQGMDSVIRQNGQHVEFEAEWETGINLQLKLAPVLALCLEWCGTDYIVLVKVIRMALRKLESIQGEMLYMNVELCEHFASCIDYNISHSLPVSVHIPLSRFVAGLLLHLEKFRLNYYSPVFSIERQPTPVQLMEIPLRVLVLVAQFRAGMWRRNGYSLLNQVFFYQNVRLRDQMFDKDILMLQICASMLDSNLFLIHVLNKFGLLSWANELEGDATVRKTEDETMRLTVAIAEEFLLLILYIVSERYTPGVGQVDSAGKIKKEIIQLLCIEPMPHSQLTKQLPKDPNHETGMESVINEVADFKQLKNCHNATQYKGKKIYELKTEYYKEFNPYFYHYSREEQSKASEVQMKRKKLQGDEECCPPPVPVEFCPNFAPILNILQCDVMIHILKKILQRSLNAVNTFYHSENQLEKALYLIGTALHEEARSLEKEDNSFSFTEKSASKNILGDLEELLNCQKLEGQHRDLLKWTIKKYKSVESARARTKGQDTKETPMDVTFSTEEQTSDPKKDRKKNAALAAARRERIMAQMSVMQKNFIKEHADLFKAVEADDIYTATSVDNLPQTNTTEENKNPIAVGNNQWGKLFANPRYTCILCREEQDVCVSSPSMVLAAFVQRSTVLSKNRKHKLDDPANYDPLFVHSDLFSGAHVSSCGHLMHAKCWQKFFESILNKEKRRPIRYGRHISFDVDKSEFLCPLCERLSNSVIPLIPSLTGTVTPNPIAIDEYLLILKKAVEKSKIEFIDHSTLLPHLENQGNTNESPSKNFQYFKVPTLTEIISDLSSDAPPQTREETSTQFSQSTLEDMNELFLSLSSSKSIENLNYHETLIQMMVVFSQVTYTVGLGMDPNPDDIRVPVMAWQSCAFTIHAMEWILRDQNKPVFSELSSRHAHCLQAIVRFAATSLRIFEKRVIRTHAAKLFRYLLLPDIHASHIQCCLNLDAFSLALFISLSLPSLFEREEDQRPNMPQGHALDSHGLQLVLVFHFVQLLLTLTPETPETDSAMDESLPDSPVTQTKEEMEENDVILIFYQELLTAAGVVPDKLPKNGACLRNRIHSGALPFLRCCALYYHFLTDVAPPSQLQHPSISQHHEFHNLCKYLGLSTYFYDIISPSLRQLALNWARHSAVRHLLTLNNQDTTIGPLDVLVRQPLSVNQLVSLPSDYSELINYVSLFTCPNSEGDDCRHPTMCLVCGEVLCSQSYCCQKALPAGGGVVGACSFHAFTCGAGVGLFLRIRDCKILLLAGKTKGCYLAAPYVDEYGESDLGLLRGNPLFLCPEHYQTLHRLWLNHGLAETVAHELEQSNNLSASNWQLL